MLASRRLFQVAAFASLAIIVLLLGFSTSVLPAPLSALRGVAKARKFILLVPATASNLNLCKLLFSAKVTGFPDPVLLGWEGHGVYDGAQSHLFKVSETLAYLDALPPSSEDDLVLILDGYDIWLQLRPEVLISRYEEVLQKQNTRLHADGLLGNFHGGAEVRQGVVFGPDKTCWPEDDRRFACWGVPRSPQAEDIYGGETDQNWGTNRARWLNSGTIIGPVKEVRDLFNATMNMIHRRFDEEFEFHNSDQYYFQEVWAEQEYNRLLLRDGEVRRPQFGDEVGMVPDVQLERRTEFHITIDYETDMFQTSAYYTDYMTWMLFNQSQLVPETLVSEELSTPELTPDILQSDPPFSTGDEHDNLPASLRWQDVPLGTNINTRRAFPLYHVTGIKEFRETWWPRMWWHPHGKALLKASQRRSKSVKPGKIFAKVGGVSYVEGVPVIEGKAMAVTHPNARAEVAAWSDRGERLSWETLCAVHEDGVFLQQAGTAEKSQ